MSSAAAAASQRQRPQRAAAITAIKKNAELAKEAEDDAIEDGEVRARGGGARSASKSTRRG